MVFFSSFVVFSRLPVHHVYSIDHLSAFNCVVQITVLFHLCYFSLKSFILICWICWFYILSCSPCSSLSKSRFAIGEYWKNVLVNSFFLRYCGFFLLYVSKTNFSILNYLFNTQCFEIFANCNIVAKCLYVPDGVGSIDPGRF